MKGRIAASVVLLGLVAAGCSGGAGEEVGQGSPPAEAGEQLNAQVASYDLAVGSEARLLVGLLTPDNLFVSGGTVQMRLSFLGDGEPEFYDEVTGSFLGLPGEEPSHADTAVGPASEGRGVYSAPVTFDRPGVWQVEATAVVDGESRTGTAAFEVLAEHRVPAVGGEALRTENLTMQDTDAPPGAIDSRADTEGSVPDPELHATTIAAAIDAGHPAVVVFATPVYCISQFCGPITDMVQGLAADYSDRADFIHVEIWRDFQNTVVNQAAADWLLRDNNLNEPWVFFIDEDGVIGERWDNVVTTSEVEAVLQQLPPLP